MNAPSAQPALDLYPKCDQGPPPSPYDPSSVAVVKREFLNAYHAINLGYRRLLDARAKPANPALERAALQAIESALLARDALEDKYAPLGIAATPDFVDGFVTNITFTHPPTRTAGGSLSALFAVRPAS